MVSYKQLLNEFRFTLKYHKRLNPALWKNGNLSQADKDYLVDLAYKFVDFSAVSRTVIKDAVLTGSNANFNYTKASDVDVHILCDPLEADSNTLHQFKTQWTAAKALTLKGMPVEFYIQDDHEHLPEGQGVYSLLRNRWLVSAKHLDHIDVLESPATIEKIKSYINQMKTLIKQSDIEKIAKFKDRLHTMRGEGLGREGEFSIENVLYKELRNRGWVDHLNSHYHALKTSAGLV